MTRQTKVNAKKVKRARHSEEFKKEALALAEKVGVAVAAKELGLADSQLYGWRNSVKSKASVSEREQALATENARLKRQVAEQSEELSILKKASAYFARNQK